MGVPFEEMINRIKPKIIKEFESECWLWIAGSRPSGYGNMTVNKVKIGAHRVMHIMFKGSIPESMDVCHECDNTWCVNPEHLWAGTRKENMQDSVQKGRNYRGGAYRAAFGKNQGHAKLTDEKVTQILRDNRSQFEVGKSFGISEMIIGRIRRGELWKHVKRPESMPKIIRKQPAQYPKTTWAIIDKIRDAHANGAHPIEIAKAVQKSRKFVDRVVANKIWKSADKQNPICIEK